MSPRCGPDHGDPPHKDFATPLWPGSRRSTSQGFCHPTVARITAIHLTRVLPPHCGPDHGDPPHKGFATPLWPGSRRSTSQGICHPILAPDHVDPPHKGFANPSWPQITSIHLTRVLPPHPGPRSRRSTSQGFCHPILAPDHVDPPHKNFATNSWVAQVFSCGILESSHLLPETTLTAVFSAARGSNHEYLSCCLKFAWPGTSQAWGLQPSAVLVMFENITAS